MKDKIIRNVSDCYEIVIKDNFDMNACKNFSDEEEIAISENTSLVYYNSDKLEKEKEESFQIWWNNLVLEFVNMMRSTYVRNVKEW